MVTMHAGGKLLVDPYDHNWRYQSSISPTIMALEDTAYLVHQCPLPIPLADTMGDHNLVCTIAERIIGNN